MQSPTSASQSPESLPAANQSKEESTLDAILIRLDEFGRFQIVILVLTCLPVLFNAVSSVTYIFTAGNVAHRWACHGDGFENNKNKRNNKKSIKSKNHLKNIKAAAVRPMQYLHASVGVYIDINYSSVNCINFAWRHDKK